MFSPCFVLGRRSAMLESAVIGMPAAAAVFLWRKSANMPQLNEDGLREFSANDWLAPVITFVVLSMYGQFVDPGTIAGSPGPCPGCAGGPHC